MNNPEINKNTPEINTLHLDDVLKCFTLTSNKMEIINSVCYCYKRITFDIKVCLQLILKYGGLILLCNSLQMTKKNTHNFWYCTMEGFKI